MSELKLSKYFKISQSMNVQENHVIIGLGGTGGRVIRAFRKRIYNEFDKEQREKLPIGYIYVDASNEMMGVNDSTWKVFGDNTQIGKNSQLFLRGMSLRAQLDNVDDYPKIKNWIGNRNIWDNIVENIADDGAAGQRRRLGRFLFACKIDDFTTILNNQVQQVRSKLNTADITFHIVAGLAGGTGSGSIIDVIAQIRKLYPRNETGPRFRLLVYAFMPEESPKPGWDKGYYHANGYAALLELNALSMGKSTFSDIGAQSQKIDFKGNVVFDGCYLYSNLNENGVIVDSEQELPNIVSDFLLQKIIMPIGSEANSQLRRAESNENLSDTFEYDENKPNQERVRSFRFLGFGVKRIEIPEEEILEYLTYNLTKQVLLQFKYNNWSDDLGFRESPNYKDYHSYVTDKDKMRAWLLSDEHLTLSAPILSDDRVQNWRTIYDDWNAEIVRLKSIAWGQSIDIAPTKLAQICEERFDRGFRKNGVQEYYRIKTLSVKNIAREIKSNFERNLFEEWRTGNKSISEVSELVETLTSHLSSKLMQIDSELVRLEDSIKNNIQEKNGILFQWSNLKTLEKIGFLDKRPGLYDTFGTSLQRLFTDRTLKEAWIFGKTLLSATINELQELNSILKTFSGDLNNMIDQAEKLISVRCNDESFNPDSLKDAQVKYYTLENVVNFKDRIVRDKKLQNEQLSAIRAVLINKIGNDPTFSKMSEKISSDILLDTLENYCRDYTVDIHNQLVLDKKKKVIGLNIIEKLFEDYNSNPEALNDFVRDIVQYSGSFINFNQSELLKTLQNNPVRTIGQTIKIETVVIRIPSTPDKKEFVAKLKHAFQNSISGNKQLHFDEHAGVKRNEITIISLVNGFPVRVVGEAKILKEKYEATIKREDENVARLVLHMEGDGLELSPLFLLSREDKVKAQRKLLEENLPFVLIANSMDIIAKQDKGDGTGKLIYGIAMKDDLGMAAGLIELGANFIEIENSLTESITNIINLEVNAKLSNEYLNVKKREEIIDSIVYFMNNVILEECGKNSNNPTYLLFHNAARRAIKLLK